MKKASESAFPQIQFPHTEPPIVGGLSKRELFAAMAMQGGLSCQMDEQTAFDLSDFSRKELAEFVAENAVLYADALLAELAKEPEKL